MFVMPSYFPMYSAIMWLIYPSSIMTWCFNYALIYFYFQSAGCIVYVLLIIFSIYFIVYLVLYSIYYNLVVWCVLFLWIFPYMPVVLCIFPGASFFPWRHSSPLFFIISPHRCCLWTASGCSIGQYFFSRSMSIGWFLDNLVFLRLSDLVLLFHCCFPIKTSVSGWLWVGSEVACFGRITELVVPLVLVWSLSFVIPILSPTPYFSYFCPFFMIILIRVNITS